jgi:hypothetical protein
VSAILSGLENPVNMAFAKPEAKFPTKGSSFAPNLNMAKRAESLVSKAIIPSIYCQEPLSNELKING